MRPLKIEEVQRGLEGKGIEAGRAKLVAHISGGRFGYALRLVENDDLLEIREERLNELLTLLPASRVEKFKYADKDVLEITVFNLPELSQTVRVSEDCSITLSLLGRVEVAGLTAQELERKLAELLDRQYTKNARMTVFIREFQKVAVIGAVGRPGLYELVGPTTLLHVIAQAGGLTAQTADELCIYRQGSDGKQAKITIKIEELTVNGKQELNIQLEPRDVVAVPIDRMLNVFVYGEVHSPGAIAYLSSKKITLLQSIAQAGGTTEWAKKSSVMIKRKDKKPGKEMTIRADLKRMMRSKVTVVVTG